MEKMIILAVLAIYGLSYFIYYSYGKDDSANGPNDYF